METRAIEMISFALVMLVVLEYLSKSKEPVASVYVIWEAKR